MIIIIIIIKLRILLLNVRRDTNYLLFPTFLLASFALAAFFFMSCSLLSAAEDDVDDDDVEDEDPDADDVDPEDVGADETLVLDAVVTDVLVMFAARPARPIGLATAGDTDPDDDDPLADLTSVLLNNWAEVLIVSCRFFSDFSFSLFSLTI